MKLSQLRELLSMQERAGSLGLLLRYRSSLHKQIPSVVYQLRRRAVGMPKIRCNPALRHRGVQPPSSIAAVAVPSLESLSRNELRQVTTNARSAPHQPSEEE